MKLKEKYERGLSGGVTYVWAVDEIKTEKGALSVLAKVAKAGDLVGFYFSGYDDMDEHGNEVSFKTVEDLKKGLGKVRSIGADTAGVEVVVGGERVDVAISPYVDRDEGTFVRVSAGSEALAKKISAVVKKAVVA